MNEQEREKIINELEALKDKINRLAFSVHSIGIDRDLDEALFVLTILNIKFQKILEAKLRTINVKLEIRA